MIATFAALILAHALADFVFQTGWMVANKRKPEVLALHGLLVLALSVATLGWIAWPIVALAVLHLVTDAAKIHLAPSGLGSFLADQAAHLAVIAAVALLWPDLWQSGVWASRSAAAHAPQVMLILAGAILATRAGGFAVGMLMSRLATRAPDGLAGGLPGAGEVIGLLERGLTFMFLMLGQPEAVGFLLAAKSILRFGAIKEDRQASEYVLIGTLASFGWAILIAEATKALVALLPAGG